MISDWEIWACAQRLIERYGEDAAFHAAQRADELLAAGDTAGERTWLAILERINTFTAPPTTSDPIH